MYIAHSHPNDDGKNKWEPLYSSSSDDSCLGHLNRVSELLASFAEVLTFDMGDL